MCIFEICRGQVCPMDLVGIEIAEDNQFSNPSVQNNPNPRNLIYSFMGVILGLIADIDIESESLRCLGGDLRTSIYGIIRIISLRKYDIEISYLPSEEKTSKLSIPSQSDAAEAFADNKGKGDFECSNNKTFGTASPRPPPLHESLPDNWITERNNFVMVMANFMSHIADVNLCYCDCKLNDGKINLNLCGQNTTRRELMRAWTQMEDGTGVGGNSDFPKPIGKTIECTAFRIVPKRNRSQIIAADGEVLPYGPFQCHILPGLARVMTSKKN
ncbi:sphingosine kinase 1-like [Styela clava]